MKVVLIILFSITALFSLENQLPSCYEGKELSQELSAPAQELFVLIDQTTFMGGAVQKYTFDNVKKMVKPGNAVTIITFSSNQGNNATQVLFSGMPERPLSASSRNSISKKVLRRFDACIEKQHALANKKIYKALKEAYGGTDPDIPNSDIFLNLYQLSNNVISRSKAEKKLLLISSDMIEHSSITSFYDKGILKNVDIDSEFKKYLKSDLVCDFYGTRVFVVGSGISNKQHYNDPKKMRQLKGFWERYFTKNRAELIEFGQPVPLGGVF